MIKLRLRREGTDGPFIVLGLSDMNLTKLREGMPITFPLAQLGLGDGEVMIMSGKTERAMLRELERECGIDIGDHVGRAIVTIEDIARKQRS